MKGFGVLWRQTGFKRLLIGQGMSDFANWLDFLALSAVIVYTWGHGAYAIAALSICIGLPWVLVGPWCSFRVGRLPGRAVLIACDLFRGVIVFLMIWAESLPWLLALVFLKMCASSIFDPVRLAGIKHTVERSALAEASAISHMTTNATKIVAPMVGGVCIAAWDVTAPFWIGSALYFLSAIVFIGLPHWRGETSLVNTRFREQIRDALAYIGSKPLLGFGIRYMGAVMFLLFLYDGLFVLFTERLGLGEASLGVLMSGVGVGSVLGALAAGRWTFWKGNPLRLMTRLGMLSGLMIAVVGIGAFGFLPTSIWFWTPFFVVMSMSGGFGAVPFGYILQTGTTEETIGPVSALSNALQTGMMLVAPALGALLSSWIGVGGVFLAAGITMSAFAAIYGWSLSPRLRKGLTSLPGGAGKV